MLEIVVGRDELLNGYQMWSRLLQLPSVEMKLSDPTDVIDYVSTLCLLFLICR